ncbi:hypothetical protein IFM89_009019 [Coptis chinensis]|uniref:Major facilitator superfamily (MFS) profile domain-containing protein n=1 Tax=Coptis chinensis TaxID=261450 RepID=A0A835I0M1_9MAGN|nr:hypothetical protein IFM89_009019 [Coptis chinensis]
MGMQKLQEAKESFAKAMIMLGSPRCHSYSLLLWFGFGIGGDYSLSATIMSKYANKKTRGAFLAAVFAMQGFGILAGRIVGIIVSSAFNPRFGAPSYLIDPKGLTVPVLITFG